MGLLDKMVVWSIPFVPKPIVGYFSKPYIAGSKLEDALNKVKDYDPHVLRDYAHHVRWKVQKIIPERYGEQKNKAGVEVTDGGIRIMRES